MKIKIYTIDQNTGTQTLEGECDLDEALDRDDPEYIEALDALQRQGRYLVGGGAAPLSLLMRGGE
jgi:hypothetical protein